MNVPAATCCAAYGSNLNAGDLASFLARHGWACGLPTVLGAGWLLDRSLGFRRRSVVRAGGVLDVQAAPGHAAPAVLMACTPAQWDALDAKEGTREGHYRRAEAVFVHRADGRHEPCVTYEVVNREPATPPSAAYARLVEDGFGTHGLDGQVLARAAALDAHASLVRHLWVYGTLRRGGPNHGLLERAGAVWVDNAWVAGRLHDAGAYPAWVGTQDSGGPPAPWVHGELFALPAEDAVPTCLAALDRLEGVDREPPLFRRTLVQAAGPRGVTLAWAYGYARPVDGLVRIPTGTWDGTPRG